MTLSSWLFVLDNKSWPFVSSVRVEGFSCELHGVGWFCILRVLVGFSRSGGPMKSAKGSSSSFVVVASDDGVLPNGLLFLENSETKNLFMAYSSLLMSPLYQNRFTFFTWMDNVSKFSNCAVIFNFRPLHCMILYMFRLYLLPSFAAP